MTKKPYKLQIAKILSIIDLVIIETQINYIS